MVLNSPSLRACSFGFGFGIAALSLSVAAFAQPPAAASSSAGAAGSANAAAGTEAPATPTGQAPPATAAAAPEFKPWPASAILLPLQSSSLTSQEVESFSVLFISFYEGKSGGRVMPPSEAEQALAQLSTPQRVMQASGATRYITGSLVKLDSRIVITLSSYDSSGRRIAEHKLTAASLDDFEMISERMALALAENTDTSETRDLDNITAREGQRPQRVAADDKVGFRGGAVIPVSGTPMNTMVNASLDVRFESEQHAVGFAVGLLIPAGGPETNGSYGGLCGEVTYAHYLTDNAFAPYVGGGLSARLLGTNSASNSGANLAPYALLGATFNRDSGAQAYVELRASQNITPITVGIGPENPLTLESQETRREYPFEPSLNAGVAF